MNLHALLNIMFANQQCIVPSYIYLIWRERERERERIKLSLSNVGHEPHEEHVYILLIVHKLDAFNLKIEDITTTTCETKL